jgi:hypothetical protein
MCVLYNSKVALMSIMFVFHDFAEFGHFLLFLHIFKNGDENLKNDFLHMVYFRNPEIERNPPLSNIFDRRSFEVVRGHGGSLEDIFQCEDNPFV